MKIYDRCDVRRDFRQFEQDVHELVNKGKHIVFICYDVVALRQINNAHGRKAGDEVLCAMSAWIEAQYHCAVYQIDGDMYCAVLKNCDLLCAMQAAREIETRFAEAWWVTVDGYELALFTSASISVIEMNEYVASQYLLDLFERALEHSRKEKNVTVFDKEMDRISKEAVKLQMDLKSCILQGMIGFDVVFQPIADPISGTWKGLETLCRWNRPNSGPVSPFTFIQEVERMGLIHMLGTWVLDTAVIKCKELKLDRLDEFYVSINISAMQIIRYDFVDIVLGVLSRNDFPSEKLLLEITESTEFVINDFTRTSIDVLRKKGVKFALDDFGTGYSSFNSLKNMPVDYLKTERAFIENIEQDHYLQYFFFVLSEVAHASGIFLIAEGVETKSQLACVVKNGADLIQGYYFGKPMSSSELQHHIANFHTQSAVIQCDPPYYINFNKWMNSNEAYNITPSLFLVLSRCMDIVTNSETPEAAVNMVLGIVGAHFKVERAYVFLKDEGCIFSNKYEWCAENIDSQMALFQRVDGSKDGFYDVLAESKLFITSTYTELPRNLRDRLDTGGVSESICSMIVMPLTKQKEVIGFVGFDDSRQREWMPEEMLVLHNLCMLVLLVLSSKGGLYSLEDDKPVICDL